VQILKTSASWQVGIFFQVKSACELEMAKQGAGVNFTPVGGLVTTGPYEHSRNPIYVAGGGVLLGFAVLFDSSWLLLSGLLVPLYIHTLVIPVEVPCPLEILNLNPES
jgi:protein-S-isoprenylcysteine O-methyltransferase Ste14